MTLDRLYASLRDPGRNPLRTLQENLDRAVATVYGFTDDEDVLAQLLALNLSIAEEERAGITEPRRPGNEGLPDTKKTTVRIEPAERLTPAVIAR